MGGMDDSSERPPPRSSPPKRKPELIVIDAKVHEPRRFAAASAATATVGLAGAIGGGAGAVLALAAAWAFTTPTDLTPLQAQVAALEADAKADGAKRQVLSEVVAKLAQRMDALEDARATDDAGHKAGAEATDDLRSTTTALQRDLAAERGAGAETGRRLAALEAAALRPEALAPLAADAHAAKETADRALAAAGAALRPEALAPLAADSRAAREIADRALAAAGAAKDDPRLADLAALKSRLDGLAIASAAPKSEMRVAPGAPPQSAAAARAVVALAAERRLAAGEPLKPELDALDRLGVAAAALAPLRTYAESGAPSLAGSAAAFEVLAASWPDAAGASPAAADPAHKILGEVQGLVKIRKVGESPRDDVAERVSAIRADLAAGDFARAVADLDRLPPPARESALGLRDELAARLAADKAAAALVDDAVAALGAGR